MVQGIENLSRIAGRVVARRAHPTLTDYDVLRVALESAAPVEGKADLLGAQVGKEIDVAVRRALIPAGGASARLECRAKRTPDGAMCEPHPDTGDFSLR
jgi:hypothetical protein